MLLNVAFLHVCIVRTHCRWTLYYLHVNTYRRVEFLICYTSVMFGVFSQLFFNQSVKITYADIVLQVDIKYYPMNIILINIGN